MLYFIRRLRLPVYNLLLHLLTLYPSFQSIDDNTPLGVASQFKWNQNSGNITSSTLPSLGIGNSFAALDSARNIGGTNDSTGRDNHIGRDDCHSKGSMERYQYGVGGKFQFHQFQFIVVAVNCTLSFNRQT